MNNMTTVLKTIAGVAGFLLSLGLILFGHGTTGWAGLLCMCAGLGGLIALLGLYNQSQK